MNKPEEFDDRLIQDDGNIRETYLYSRDKQLFDRELEKRAMDVKKIDEIRQRLLEIHGEFSDAVEFVREDRER